MEAQLGEHQAGPLRQGSAQAKAERIMTEELNGLKWQERQLKTQPRNDPAKP